MMNKVLRSTIIIILLIISVLMFTACATGAKVVEIEVDNDTIEDFYDVADFDVSMVYIILHFEGNEEDEEVGETERIPLTKNMIKAEDQVKLLVPGEHNITVTHKQRSTTFILKLREGISGKYKVVFLNEDGSPIGETQYISPGSSAVSPTVPTKANHDFDGWIDQRGDFTFYDNIMEDKTYTATFTPDFCTIKFILPSGVEIAQVEIKKGTSVRDLAPDFPVLPGQTAVGWNGSLDNIRQDTTITAEYKQDTINVYFAFGDDGRQHKVANFAANTTISPIDSPQVGHAEFLGWYTNENFEGEIVKFPYLLQNEITFYAKYVSKTKGSDGLEYSYSGSNTYTISDYVGNDNVIVIPEKYNNLDVVGIENRAFIKSKATRFYVTDSNNYFSITDGVLFDLNKEKLIAYPAGKADNQYNLPFSVKSIENYAFSNAKNLVIVNYQSTQNLISIGSYAFYDCTNLFEMNIPKTVQKIGEYAFLMETDSKLSTFTFAPTCDLQQIGREAFRGLNKLSIITLPSTKLDNIGSSAFYGCSQLREILLEGNTSNYFASINGVLYDNTIKTLIAYPANSIKNGNAAYTVENNVETIKAGAFINPNIVGVVLPSSIISIEGFAFNSPRLQYIRFMGDSQPSELSDVMFGNYNPAFIVVPEEKASEYTSFEEMQIIEGALGETYFYNELLGYIYTKDSNDKLTLLGLRKQSENLTIPETVADYPVTKIGKYAFYNNKVIKNVVISEGIQIIDDNAFFLASALQSITLPESLLQIGKSAFSDCLSLTTVINGEDILLNKIGEEAFLLCPWYDEATDEFLMIGDILISYNGNGMQAILPERTKVIADSAFIEKSNLTSIKLNSGLIDISSYAFYGCGGIFHIEIPETVEYIGEYAFVYCPNLYRIIMLSKEPPELSAVDEVFTTDATYIQNTNVYEFSIIVPYNVTSSVLNSYKNDSLWGRYNLMHLIERDATFSGSGSVQVPVIANVIYEPDPPQERPGYVFAGWYLEEELSYQMSHDPLVFPFELDATIPFYSRLFTEEEGSSGIEYIPINDEMEYAVYKYTGNLKYVVIPNQYKGKPVTKILSGAFSSAISPTNTEIYKILLPDTIEVIEEDAFSETKWYNQYLGDFVYINNILIEYRGNAEKVEVPADIRYLVKGAFKNNSSLKEITLPNDITILPADVFYNATYLSKISLPTSLTKIEERAFMNCKSLRTINFSPTLEDIAPDAFKNTKWLEYYVDDVVIINSVLYQYKGKQSSLHIPNIVSKVEKQAFKNNIFLQNLYVPNTLMTIGESAFEGCINIRKVQFAEGTSINSIEAKAFYGCLMLENFNLGDNRLINIGDYAFADTSNLISADIPSSLKNLGVGAYRESGIKYVNFENRGVLEEILEYTFMNCRYLKAVVFGDNTLLRYIATSAFENCGNLMTVTIPDTNRYLTKIDNRAFYDAVSLDNVILPTSLMEIGDDAFAHSPYLDSNDDIIMTVGSVLLKYAGNDTSVVISKEIAAISKGAFKDNATIKNIEFEEGSNLFAIGEEAFMNCIMLKTINFPLTLTHIGDNALLNTKWLNEYADDFVIVNNLLIKYIGDSYQAIVPANVSVIGIDAFNGNTKLRNIEIGVNVTKIEPRAFDNMSVSSTITMLNPNPPTLNQDNNIVSRIYVENTSIFNNYRENEKWSRFVNDANESIIIKYIINFDLQSLNATMDISKLEVNALFVEPTPVLQNFTFIGWYETTNFEGTGKYGGLVSLPYFPTHNITLYAKWIDNENGTPDVDLTVEDIIPQNAVEGTYITKYNLEDRFVMVPAVYAEKVIIGIAKNGTDNAFAGNTTLEEVVFLQGYESQGVTYSGSQLRYILEGAFEGATNLRRIVLPASLEYIGVNAFKGCTSLEEVIFVGNAAGSASLVIDENAFEDCTSLKTITFPTNTTSIGDEAFKYCASLTTIYMESDMPPEGNTPFDINSELKIYVNRSIDDTIEAIYKEKWALYEQVIFSRL